ncbi:hypothetical protein BT63DRAFT_241191 [Microthyrium microscopicum]|uniref:Uncharacterized protein n=1 Tax=Microthyrium microscopicum TaxID=703497 RepID=A0A6A6UE43_9PEZI|nr:hypothetical protein BT63DRAFT_241191 [Microthyrium microscopicum]
MPTQHTEKARTNKQIGSPLPRFYAVVVVPALIVLEGWLCLPPLQCLTVAPAFWLASLLAKPKAPSQHFLGGYFHNLHCARQLLPRLACALAWLFSLTCKPTQPSQSTLSLKQLFDHRLSPVLPTLHLALFFLNTNILSHHLFPATHRAGLLYHSPRAASSSIHLSFNAVLIFPSAAISLSLSTGSIRRSS